MKHHSKIISLLFFFCLSFSISASEDAFDDFRSLIQKEMKEIVAALTGEESIGGGVYLRDRWSMENRNLARKLLKDRYQARQLPLKEHSYDNGSGKNLYSIIPSTTSSFREVKTILLGAHYDSVRNSPGANDNATGMALLYGVASMVKQLECRELNIMVALFDEEEIRLKGSKAFARLLKEQGIAIHSVHTIDQMGWDQDGDMAFEIERPSHYLKELYNRINQEKKFFLPIYETSVNTSDHESFRALGWDAIGITEEYMNGDTTPHYHLPSDLFATVNFPYLNTITHFIEEVVTTLAKGDSCL